MQPQQSSLASAFAPKQSNLASAFAPKQPSREENAAKRALELQKIKKAEQDEVSRGLKIAEKAEIRADRSLSGGKAVQKSAGKSAASKDLIQPQAIQLNNMNGAAMSSQQKSAAANKRQAELNDIKKTEKQAFDKKVQNVDNTIAKVEKQISP